MSGWFRDNIEALQGYTPGFQPADARAIKLNTNENPYPPSPRVFEALAELDGVRLRRYPPILWDQFRRTAARLHDVHPEQVVAGNGGDEILNLLVRCCCDEQRALAYPVPTYSLYPTLAALQNTPTVEIPFAEDYQIPKELFDIRAGLVFFCNPNAPSCTFVPPGAVEELVGRTDGVICVDEAYVDFAPENCVPLLKRHENLIILRSLSKGYSLAGMRFGYALTSERIAGALIKAKDSYNVNIAAQVAAVAALEDQDYFCRNIEKIKQQRRRLITELRDLGFCVGESHTNFLLAGHEIFSARGLHEQLSARDIYVRYFDQAGLNNKLRISVGTAEENEALLNALREIMNED